VITRARPVEKVVEVKLRYLIGPPSDRPAGVYFLVKLTVSQQRYGSYCHLDKSLLFA